LLRRGRVSWTKLVRKDVLKRHHNAAANKKNGGGAKG